MRIYLIKKPERRSFFIASPFGGGKFRGSRLTPYNYNFNGRVEDSNPIFLGLGEQKGNIIKGLPPLQLYFI